MHRLPYNQEKRILVDLPGGNTADITVHNHYFIFKIETYSDNKLIRKFIYQKTTTSLE